MSYDCLGGNRYRIYTDIYRDGLESATPFDAEAYFVVFNSGSRDIYRTFSVPLRSSSEVQPNDLNACLDKIPPIRFFQGKYQFDVELPQNGEGYTIVHQRCCRTEQITNLFSSGNQGSTYTLEIMKESLSVCNSSPKFDNPPPVLMCINVPLDYPHSASDADGDNIRYKFCAPYKGGSVACPIFGINPTPSGCPFDPPSPPYGEVSYSGGFTASKPMGNGVLTLNASTGKLTGTPRQVGKYVVGICLEEFRGGVLMSRSFRDFQYTVNDCGVSLAGLADIPDYECSGFTVDFSEQNSSGGQTFFWDFGDGQTSTEEFPVHTYATSGTYTVKLVINEGLACEDEATTTINVYPIFDVKFSFVQDCSKREIAFTNETFSSFNDVNSTLWTFNGGSATSVAKSDIFNYERKQCGS